MNWKRILLIVVLTELLMIYMIVIGSFQAEQPPMVYQPQHVQSPETPKEPVAHQHIKLIDS